MKFSIIIPSYNQHQYIEETLANAVEIKETAASRNIIVEILLFDSQSNEKVQAVIEKYRSKLDYTEVKKDNGQFDAINKGIQRSTADYWTWLNTDDTLDKEGFFKTVDILLKEPAIDYIYGSIDYINETSQYMRSFPSYPVNLELLVKKVPGIFQQGSFFSKRISDKAGLLKGYNCCFDYEYVLRCLKAGAKVYVCDFKVANFRQHNISKTGSLTPIFISEQLQISKEYGRKPWNYLSWFSQLRLIKHKLFPRK